MSIVEVVFLIVFWTWVFSAVLLLRNTFLPRLPITATPAQFNLEADTVHFPATDGVQLEGWKILGDPEHPWIILCHGLGANRADLLDVAAGLHAQGFNLFLFDFRAHGSSQGRVTSFGYREQRDLAGALVFLGQQPDVKDHPYGIYGISMGGSVALMVAAQDERLGAIAVDSPYTDLDLSIALHTKLMFPWLPKQPFHWFVCATYRVRFGIWPSHASPKLAAANLGKRPLLILQGAADPRMPLQGAKDIIASASGPSELVALPGGHLEGYSHDPAAYYAHLGEFFRDALL